MQAVIASGGKQYIVKAGDIVDLELLGDVKKFEFDALMTFEGSNVSIGTPLVDKIKVHAELIDEVKGDKLKIMKFKAKKRVKRLTGHRQKYTQVKITKIA